MGGRAYPYIKLWSPGSGFATSGADWTLNGCGLPRCAVAPPLVAGEPRGRHFEVSSYGNSNPSISHHPIMG